MTKNKENTIIIDGKECEVHVDEIKEKPCAFCPEPCGNAWCPYTKDEE